MEHRLMDGGFTLTEIKDMDSSEVIDRYSALLFVDEIRKGDREEDTKEWSHLALTK